MKNQIDSLKTTQYDNLRVAIRVRPPLPREMDYNIPFRSIAVVSTESKSISLAEYLGAELDEVLRQREWVEKPYLFQLHRFTFDAVFDSVSTQDEVYDITAKPAVESVLEGYNSTILAYGQTGTGKTYTMEGFTYTTGDPQRGIIQRTIEDIFTYIESTSNEDTKFIIRANYLQIYNENISDLLKPEKKNLQIREDKKKGIYVDLLSDWAVRTPIDLYALLKRGASFRATASTYMNDVSSRSHAVFVITVEQMTTQVIDGQTHTQIKVGKLNLVDLAGSERIRITGAKGQQLEESKKINKSLSCLGNVINALTDQKGRIHIPYRDSKLTRLLEDSLGGNCKTTMIAMISPAHESFSESLSTMHFAQRAKKIRNRPVINEDVNHRALIRQYEVELKNLRNELEAKTRLIKSNEMVIELEEQKKRAEEDKNEAIKALEQASRKYLQEREEKRNLEKKIEMMNSQMITGGHKIEDTPQFRNALQNQLKEYDYKMQEIERERQQIEEDKAETEQYKTLLLKQRDIMNALTNKLNERDEAIAQLQEELDACDKQEEANEVFIQRINQLEALLIKNKIPLPNITKPLTQSLKKIKKYDTNKTYLPYEAEVNYKNCDGNQLILLSSEEKINELRSIISEQESKIHFLDLLSKKFINTVSQDGQIDMNKFLKTMENGLEVQKKMSELEKERNKALEEIENRNDIISQMKNDLEIMKEDIITSENNCRILEKDNEKIFRLKSNLMSKMENVFKKVNDPEVKNDLFLIYQYINSGEDPVFSHSLSINPNQSHNESQPQSNKSVSSQQQQQQQQQRHSQSSNQHGHQTQSQSNIQSHPYTPESVNKFLTNNRNSVSLSSSHQNKKVFDQQHLQQQHLDINDSTQTQSQLQQQQQQQHLNNNQKKKPTTANAYNNITNNKKNGLPQLENYLNYVNDNNVNTNTGSTGTNIISKQKNSDYINKFLNTNKGSHN